MLVTAAGLALMTMLHEDTSYWWPGLFQFIVGVGSGMFNSPNTAAMMGVVAPHRRGIASGARVLVQNTGAVLSIAFVMAVVTNGIKPNRPVQHLFRPRYAHNAAQMAPFLSNMHLALWCMAGVSVIGAVVSFARPKHVASVYADESEQPQGAEAPTVAAAA